MLLMLLNNTFQTYKQLPDQRLLSLATNTTKYPTCHIEGSRIVEWKHENRTIFFIYRLYVIIIASSPQSSDGCCKPSKH